jgi:hypothetical protein
MVKRKRMQLKVLVRLRRTLITLTKLFRICRIMPDRLIHELKKQT